MRRTVFQVSAGGVVIKDRRVLLIRALTRTGRSVWTFPKGRVERGERRWDAALREVREETGYLCRLRKRLRGTSYVFRNGPVRIRKTVYWYLLEPIRKAGTPNPREVEETRWFPIDEAYQTLAYRSDYSLLRAAESAYLELKA